MLGARGIPQFNASNSFTKLYALGYNKSVVALADSLGGRFPNTRGAVLANSFETAVDASGRAIIKQIFSVFEFIGRASAIGYAAVRRIAMGDFSARDTLFQMASAGVNSLPIVLITTSFSGAVLALYTAKTLTQWGVGSLVGGLVSLSVARELAPVLTAVVVAARAGSAITAEIGTMKVTEQIDALRSLGANPIKYLVAPRFVALVAMLPVLTMISMVIGSFGGYIVAQMNGVTGVAYLNSAQQWLTVYDVVMGLLKTVFFGAFIAIVGTQQGLDAERGAAGVGKNTMNSVVISILLIYISNYFLAYIMFGGNRPGF
ncbi:MAG TPA: ABC transporter permease [Armatimonadetes bacterium]|nr:ABC transporter permease [Armatimonadota bacterium]